MMDYLFVPARIMDIKWARKFVDGEIYMSSLSKFGIWKRVEINKGDKTTGEVINTFRGDVSEGAVRTVAKPDDDVLFSGFPDGLKDCMKKGKYIDDEDLKYFNVLCLYCLRFFPQTGVFEKPSKRLNEFGDTAIVITDMNAFLNRLLEQVEWKTKYAFFINLIRYYKEDTTKDIPQPLFSKTCGYEWQNELRIAIGRLNLKKKMKNGNYPIIESDYPLKLRIGSLKDITMLVPIDDFITGNWDKGKVKFANSLKYKMPIELMFEKTEKILAQHHTEKCRISFII